MGRADYPNLKPFEPGHPGGPGRPKGSRARLQEKVLSALFEDFSVNGEAVIRRVRERKPEVYLTAVVSLLPKQAQKVESPFADISDAELEALEQHLAVVRAKLVQNIEHDTAENNATPNSRVANTETDTHGQSIQNADPVIPDRPTINLDVERSDGMDASILERNAC